MNILAVGDIVGSVGVKELKRYHNCRSRLHNNGKSYMGKKRNF